ncbi:hypothetical protein [Pseudalkalibacillus decolorationis]|uniref:hypothetical protein n=1 Tax=Pseudalkalibacillus decolorationis TaxID=163879 RepID=UPI0021488FCC|nr:hypothetical protein [Pseudalkalibacillus decolorationis]
MLKQCSEEDFYKIDIVSIDRLSPDRIPVFFWAAFIISGIMTAVVNFGSGYSIYVNNPIWPIIVKVLIAFLVIQFIVAVFFTSEKNYYKYQKLQCVLLSIFSLKLSVDIYPVYFLLCEDRDAPNFMTTTAIFLALGGLIYLIISTIRGIKRVQKGELRKDGRGLYNFKQSKAHVSLPIIFGATMLGGAIVRTLSNTPNNFGTMIELFFFLFLCVSLQYAIAFAWPEFFLLTYCKFRFESFHVPMPNRLKDSGNSHSGNKQTKQTKMNKKDTRKKRAGGRKR